MKVGELIARLKKLDQDLDVLCYTEGSQLLPKKHMFRLLEIDGVDVSEGEMCRGDDQIATLKLGKSPGSQKFAFLNVTADF